MPTYQNTFNVFLAYIVEFQSQYSWAKFEIGTQQVLDLNHITQFYYLTAILLVTSVKKMNNGARMNER